jgi:hypothetical protein
MREIHINKLPRRTAPGAESNFWHVTSTFGLKAKRRDRDWTVVDDREKECGIITAKQVAEMLASNQAYLAERSLAPKCYGVVCLVDSKGNRTYAAVTQLARVGWGSSHTLECNLQKALTGTGSDMTRDLHGGNFGTIGKRTVLVDCGAMAFKSGAGVANLKPKKYSQLTEKMVEAIRKWGE